MCTSACMHTHKKHYQIPGLITCVVTCWGNSSKIWISPDLDFTNTVTLFSMLNFILNIKVLQLILIIVDMVDRNLLVLSFNATCFIFDKI